MGRINIGKAEGGRMKAEGEKHQGGVAFRLSLPSGQCADVKGGR
jgi:hypothetical protein